MPPSGFSYPVRPGPPGTVLKFLKEPLLYPAPPPLYIFGSPCGPMDLIGDGRGGGAACSRSASQCGRLLAGGPPARGDGCRVGCSSQAGGRYSSWSPAQGPEGQPGGRRHPPASRPGHSVPHDFPLLLLRPGITLLPPQGGLESLGPGFLTRLLFSGRSTPTVFPTLGQNADPVGGRGSQIF